MKTQERKTVTTWVGPDRIRGYEYIPCQASDIPADARFDVPRRNQGQIVTISYGGFGRAEHACGDPWMCRQDASLPSDHPEREEYFRLVKKHN